MKTKKSAMLALAFAAASVSSAYSTQIALSGGPYQNGIGGEFTATVSNTPDSLDAYIGTYSSLTATNTSTSNTFQTFCIEFNEHFNWNTPYLADVSNAAINGGVPNGNDTISIGTAWLYSQFALGSLTTGNYFTGGDDNRKTQAGLLQNAIWWLEGEISIATPASNPFIAAASAAFGIPVSTTVPNVSPNSGGTGLAADTFNGHNAAWLGVYALNLGPFEGNTAEVHQDQLIFKATGNRIQTPDGGATLLLLGLSLSGMGALQRRLRKTA